MDKTSYRHAWMHVKINNDEMLFSDKLRSTLLGILFSCFSCMQCGLLSHFASIGVQLCNLLGRLVCSSVLFLPSVSPSVNPYSYLSVNQTISTSISFSACPYIWPFFCPFDHLSICSYVHPFF